MGKDMDEGLYDFEINDNALYLTTNQVLVLLCSHYPGHDKFQDNVVGLKKSGCVIGCTPEVYEEVKGYYTNQDLFMEYMSLYPEDELVRRFNQLYANEGKLTWPGQDAFMSLIKDKRPVEQYVEEKLRWLNKLKFN